MTAPEGKTVIRTVVLAVVLALVVAACATGTTDDAAPPGQPGTTIGAETPNTRETDAASRGGNVTVDDRKAAGVADESTHDEDEATQGEKEAIDGDDGADVDSEGAVGTDRVVEVTMTELEFIPGELPVAAGETVSFVVTNAGQVVHEFRLSNAHRIEEHMASGHEGHGDDAGGHHGDVDLVLELDPGDSGELTVTFPEDTTLFTEVACLIPGHYEGGMKAPINYA